MVRVDCSLQENSKSRAGAHARRIVLAVSTLVLLILSASCSSLLKDKDYTIPKLLTPVADAKFDDLTKQLQPFTDLKSLRTSQAYMLFTDAAASEKYRFEAELTLILQRPDKIRMLIQVGFGTRVADMVSESNRFRVAIYTPSEYRQFLLGTNDADYSAWMQKLKGKEKESALSSARPFHFTEALMMRPIALNDPRFVFGIEESLVAHHEPPEPCRPRVGTVEGGACERPVGRERRRVGAGHAERMGERLALLLLGVRVDDDQQVMELVEAVEEQIVDGVERRLAAILRDRL